MCVHQDVHLPDGWDQNLAEQIREAERRFGPIGVAGVYGASEVIAPADLTQPLGVERIGWVVDRGLELRDGPELPAPVATLDELLLVVRRNSDLRFDAALGLHLYGADICLQALERGLGASFWAAHPCSQGERRAVGVVFRQRGGPRPQMEPSAADRHALRDHRPRASEVHLLGSARPGHRSIAYTLPRMGASKEKGDRHPAPIRFRRSITHSGRAGSQSPIFLRRRPEV